MNLRADKIIRGLSLVQKREFPRNTNINKRLPPIKGAPAKRVRDCNTIILDDLQIGSVCRQPLRHDRYA